MAFFATFLILRMRNQDEKVKKLVCVCRNLTDSILKSAVIKIRNVVRRLKH